MPTIQKFEDLQFWQKVRQLSRKVYPLTYQEPISSDYRIRDQIRRSCGSIMDNIAEGFERGGNNEFKNSLSIAKGETGELKSQLYRCMDNNYITAEDFKELYSLADELTRMITGFMNYLIKATIKGQKFNKRAKDE